MREKIIEEHIVTPGLGDDRMNQRNAAYQWPLRTDRRNVQYLEIIRIVRVFLI